jgi:hypothetical protein
MGFDPGVYIGAMELVAQDGVELDFVDSENGYRGRVHSNGSTYHMTAGNDNTFGCKGEDTSIGIYECGCKHGVTGGRNGKLCKHKIAFILEICRQAGRLKLE